MRLYLMTAPACRRNVIHAIDVRDHDNIDVMGVVMKHQYVSAFAAIAFCLCAQIPAQAQVRVVPPEAGAVPVITPLVVPPVVAVQPQLRLEPTIKPTVVVPPPPLAHTESSPDGGDSDCKCPNGQTADVNGQCWRRTDATSGYWAKTEMCQR